MKPQKECSFCGCPAVYLEERKVIEAARNRVDQIIESNTIIEGADVELVETVSALNKLLAAEGEQK